MTILRASSAWLTAMNTLNGAGSNPSYRFAATAPPSQMNASTTLSSSQVPPTTLNLGSQTISAPGSIQANVIIPSALVRAVAGVNSASMPSEALQLSAECACDFQGAWAAVFLALGFTPFVPTVTPVPVMSC
jgi:hypothetical protein